MSMVRTVSDILLLLRKCGHLCTLGTRYTNLNYDEDSLNSHFDKHMEFISELQNWKSNVEASESIRKIFEECFH